MVIESRIFHTEQKGIKVFSYLCDPEANLFESCIIIAHLNMGILPIDGFTIIISQVKCLLGDIYAKIQFFIHIINILEFNGIKKECWVGEGLNR